MFCRAVWTQFLRTAAKVMGCSLFILYLLTETSLAVSPLLTMGVFWGLMALGALVSSVRSLWRGQGFGISWDRARQYVTAGLLFSLFLLYLPQLQGALFAAFPWLARLPWATPQGEDLIWSWWEISFVIWAVIRLLRSGIMDRTPRPVHRWEPPRF
ncbi:hypothetical protein ACVNPS_02460 [Candidatus Bipolaricaulota sp. J31]